LAVYPEFLLFVLVHLQAGRRNVPSIKQTTGIQNIDEQDYLSNKIGLPPLSEQREIVGRIQKRVADVLDIEQRTQREIDLIREYRTRLIADVVTGRVDVRHLASADEELEDADRVELTEHVDADEEIAEESELVEEAES
jgi:type I restriction enzyme S subunit